MNVIVTTELRVGSTWLCDLLTSLFNTGKYSFIKGGDYGPYKRTLNRLPKRNHHVVKIHHVHPSKLVDKIDKVISITRDVRDTIISRAFYENNRRRRKQKLKGKLVVERFLRMDIIKNVVDEWKKYNDGYAHPNYLLIHYEDLKRTPMKEMLKICKFLDFKKNNNQLLRIINKNKFVKSSHNRKGIIGDHVNYFGEDIIKKIEEFKK